VNSFISKLRLVLISAWLGVAIFFAAWVAPTLFGVLRGAGLQNASNIAGTIVSRLLSVINSSGFEIAFFALVTALFINRDQQRASRIAEVISLLIMAIMAAAGQWVVTPRMAALRAAMQAPIDQIAANDPRRMAFDNLHKYSVLLLSIAMLAAIAAIIFAKVSHKSSK
jgi:hypothetical protein